MFASGGGEFSQILAHPLNICINGARGMCNDDEEDFSMPKAGGAEGDERATCRRHLRVKVSDARARAHASECTKILQPIGAQATAAAAMHVRIWAQILSANILERSRALPVARSSHRCCGLASVFFACCLSRRFSIAAVRAHKSAQIIGKSAAQKSACAGGGTRAIEVCANKKVARAQTVYSDQLSVNPAMPTSARPTRANIAELESKYGAPISNAAYTTTPSEAAAALEPAEITSAARMYERLSVCKSQSTSVVWRPQRESVGEVREET